MHESRTNVTDREPAGAMEDLARDPGSRKRFLKMVGGAGAASAFAVFLAACNSDDGGGGGGSAAKPDVASPGGVASNRDRGGDPKEGTSDLDILNYALSL